MSFQQRNKQAHDASCRHGNLDGAESNYEQHEKSLPKIRKIYQITKLPITKVQLE